MKTLTSFFIIFLISITFCEAQTWIKSDSLWIDLLRKGKLDSALIFTEEYKAQIRGNIGEDNLQFANAESYLAISYFSFGNYKKAKYYFLNEIKIRESLKATNDSYYIDALVNTSIICRKAGNYDEALGWIKKAESKASGLYGSKNPNYANVLCSYAAVYNDMGAAVNDAVLLKKAKKYFLEASEIYKNSGQDFYYQEIANRSNYACNNNNLANYPLSESLFLEVIEYIEKKFGNLSPQYAVDINNLGVLNYNRANYKQAEKYFSEAVRIFKIGKEANSTNAAICINNLGALYHEMGNYDISIKLLKEANELLLTNLGKNNSYYALTMNNLAATNLAKEYFAAVEYKNKNLLLECGKMLALADTIFEENCSLPYPDGNAIRYNSALWYATIGDKKTCTKIISDYTYQTGYSMFNVSSLINKMSLTTNFANIKEYNSNNFIEPVFITIKIKSIPIIDIEDSAIQKNRQYPELSTQLLLKAIVGNGNKVKKALGPYNPEYANLLSGLSILYYSLGDDATEEKMKIELMDIIIHNTLQDFNFLSESEKEMYFDTRESSIHGFIAYANRRVRRNPSIAGYTYNLVMQNKGLMLKSNTAMRMAILNSNDSTLIKKYDNWISLQKKISALYSTPVEFRKEDVGKLEIEANNLEKILVQSSQDFNNYSKSIKMNWQDVRNSLKSNEAAIEFTNYKVKKKNGVNTNYYCALVLKSNSKFPEMIRVFEEKDLLTILGTYEENNLKFINSIYGTKELKDNKLYKLIWLPLEKYLNGIDKVYLSPSGLLNKISFASISNGTNIFLCKKYHLQMENSTANIVKQSALNPNDKLLALVFGGIQYGENANETQVWTYLKGTRDEGEAVKNILEKQQVEVKYLSDLKATETFLKKNAKNFNILHLATHGFVFPDPNQVRVADEKQTVEYGNIAFRGVTRGVGVNTFVNSQNPLMRSGLALAGANDVWAKSKIITEDDGVLTAQEVTQIDMRKTDLVVLSACETGLGEIKGSEGVYGLQRAFKMAGVKYIITSLWQVPDKETVEFMETFYSNLVQNHDIKLAFLNAQNELSEKYDPYFWGAFVLIE